MATDTILAIVKARLNRTDDALDDYLQKRIYAAIDQLTAAGIHLDETDGDTVFVADFVTWQYQNRDKPGAMPDWLRYQRKERWLQDRGRTM